MPHISVVIPTYNRADMVGDAVRSVLAQTYTDWEIIVIDDGSRDNTRERVESFDDLRIRYFYQNNRGLPAARNVGIRWAQGDCIAFLDSDDTFLPSKLAAQTALLDSRSELGLVAGGYIEVDKQLRFLRELRPWETQPTLNLTDWVMSCPFCPSSPLVRRAWLERIGLFDESMRRIEDWDLWLRMSQQGCQMAWLKEPVCYYRIHGGNMVRDVVLMRDGMVTMLNKLYASAGLPEEIVALRNPAYAHVYLNTAARAYAAGAVDEGQSSLDKALRLDPSLLEGDPPRVLSSLASFALGPLCGDPDGFFDRLLGHPPNVPGMPRWSKRKVRSLLHAVEAFECHQRHEHRRAAKQALSALLLDPTWLRNRGLLAILKDGFELDQHPIITRVGQ